MKENDSVYFISYIANREGTPVFYPLKGTIKKIYPNMTGISPSIQIETQDQKLFHVKKKHVFYDKTSAEEETKRLFQEKLNELDKKKEKIEEKMIELRLLLKHPTSRIKIDLS